VGGLLDGSAVVLFLLPAYFCGFRFVRTTNLLTPDGKGLTHHLRRSFEPCLTVKRHAAKSTRTCNWTIRGGLLVTGTGMLGVDYGIFTGEAIAVIAFSVAWLIKGGFLSILADN
jgi:hypothetical protein